MHLNGPFPTNSHRGEEDAGKNSNVTYTQYIAGIYYVVTAAYSNWVITEHAGAA